MHNRLRLLARAWGFSGVAVALAVLTHCAAGGHSPNPVLVSMAWALGAVVALPFAGRRPGSLRVFGLLLPAQVIYHVAFGGMHVHPHSTGTGHHLHGAELTAALGATQPVAAHTMIVAHLCSAVASVVAIRYAERGLEAVADAARALSARAARCARVRIPRIPAVRRRAWVPGSFQLPCLHELGLPPAALSRRGPPLALAVHAPGVPT